MISIDFHCSAQVDSFRLIHYSRDTENGLRFKRFIALFRSCLKSKNHTEISLLGFGNFSFDGTTGKKSMLGCSDRFPWPPKKKSLLLLTHECLHRTDDNNFCIRVHFCEPIAPNPTNPIRMTKIRLYFIDRNKKFQRFNNYSP